LTNAKTPVKVKETEPFVLEKESHTTRNNELHLYFSSQADALYSLLFDHVEHLLVFNICRI
jgi:hypothetical protein